MSRVMLINLPIQAYYQKNFAHDSGYNPSLGLISLGTWLELHGHEPLILDLCFMTLRRSDVIQKIKEFRPLILGFSVYTENMKMAIATAREIKENFPEIKIVVGGPHPTIDPGAFLKDDAIDFVTRKEGESTLLELTRAVETNEQAISYDQIPGLDYRKDGKVYHNPVRKPITDLDLLLLPKRELVEIERYEDAINISTSRGCPGKCIFCSASALSGATYRTRSVDHVYMEVVLLKLMLQEKLYKIYIVDDTFTAIPERVSRFAELIIYYGFDIKWHCESRIDVITEKLIDKMAEGGCIAIQYGIESGSQIVLNRIQKGIDLEQAKRIIDYTHKKKILLCLSFIIGHYCDTKETMEETHKLVEEFYHKYKPIIAMSYNTPFPGTWQYANRDKIGLRLVTEDFKHYSLLTPIVETDNFTVNDQREIFCKSSKYFYEIYYFLNLKEELTKTATLKPTS